MTHSSYSPEVPAENSSFPAGTGDAACPTYLGGGTFSQDVFGGPRGRRDLVKQPRSQSWCWNQQRFFALLKERQSESYKIKHRNFLVDAFDISGREASCCFLHFLVCAKEMTCLQTQQYVGINFTFTGQVHYPTQPQGKTQIFYLTCRSTWLQVKKKTCANPHEDLFLQEFQPECSSTLCSQHYRLHSQENALICTGITQLRINDIPPGT